MIEDEKFYAHDNENFLRVYEETLPLDICDQMIDMFQKDDRKYPGEVYPDGVSKEIKDSTDLYISDLPEWKIMNDILFNSTKNLIQQYYDQFDGLPPEGLFDTGYQIQESKVGQHFTWHNDGISGGANFRQFVLLWYLNDDFEGGETDFLYQNKRVRPKKGSCLIFPTCWTHVHRGVEVTKGTKYVATTWACVKWKYDDSN